MSKRKTYSLLGVMVLLVALFALSGVAWAATFSTPVDSDYTNVDNSVYVSQADFPSGAPAAVLAGSEDYTQGLVATVLAKTAGGPLLLSEDASLSTATQTELVRLKPSKVYLAGLSSTIATAVQAALPSATVVTLTGADQYQTAALVAAQVKAIAGKAPARVFIVPGDAYGSSVAAAAVAAANGWPILLTPQSGSFSSDASQAITSLGVTSGIDVDTNVVPGVSGFTVTKVIMGSASDWETMQHACKVFDDFEVPYEKRVISAQGMMAASVSATSTSIGCGRLKLTPESSCARTASFTARSPWPRMTGPSPMM